MRNCVNSDILCLNETHLEKDDTITNQGYKCTCILNNRAEKNRKASKASLESGY